MSLQTKEQFIRDNAPGLVIKPVESPDPAWEITLFLYSQPELSSVRVSQAEDALGVSVYQDRGHSRYDNRENTEPLFARFDDIRSDALWREVPDNVRLVAIEWRDELIAYARRNRVVL